MKIRNRSQHRSSHEDIQVERRNNKKQIEPTAEQVLKGVLTTVVRESISKQNYFLKRLLIFFFQIYFQVFFAK